MTADDDDDDDPPTRSTPTWWFGVAVFVKLKIVEFAFPPAAADKTVKTMISLLVLLVVGDGKCTSRFIYFYFLFF